MKELFYFASLRRRIPAGRAVEVPGRQDRLAAIRRGLEDGLDACQKRNRDYETVWRSRGGNDDHGVALLQVGQSCGGHAANGLLQIGRSAGSSATLSCTAWFGPGVRFSLAA